VLPLVLAAIGSGTKMMAAFRNWHSEAHAEADEVGLE
jgi:hypothetical protein